MGPPRDGPGCVRGLLADQGRRDWLDLRQRQRSPFGPGLRLRRWIPASSCIAQSTNVRFSLNWLAIVSLSHPSLAEQLATLCILRNRQTCGLKRAHTTPLLPFL